MRILILSNKVPYPPKDGGAVATMNVAAGLAESGNEVCLLSLNTLKHYYPENEIPVDLRKGIRLKSVVHNTSVSYTKALLNLLFSSTPYNAERFLSAAYSKELQQILLSEKFDIIQLEGPYLGWYIPLIRNFSDARISLRAHNLEYEIWSRMAVNEKNPLRKLYILSIASRIKKFERDVLKQVDLLVTFSVRELGENLKVRNDIPSIISPPGFFIEDFPKVSPKYPLTLFYIGALDWLPNQEGLLWFLDKVWLEYNFNTEFHIAGRNAPSKLQKIFSKTPGVIFHGEVESAYKFISENGIMICPLFSGSGLRIKILESMLAGKAIISTQMGTEGIPVTDGENIIVADRPKEFYEKFTFLTGNPGFIESIGNKARNFVTENFNNFVICEKLTRFYVNNL